MKERFEIVFCEDGKQAMRHEPLRCPIKNGSNKDCREDGRGKISRQSGCVFQGLLM